VQKDIDGKNPKTKVYKPGQYFVLRFDFSAIEASPDLTVARQNMIASLNSSFEEFYRVYAAYLGKDFASLCRYIDSERPNLSLQNCSLLVQDALSRPRGRENEQLAGVQGIYLLVDEYDSFSNNYIDLPNTVDTIEPRKTPWEDTALGRTFTSFWSMVKSLGLRGMFRRAFITGISPLSLSGIGSAFNVARNVSFHQDLAGLCGLTHSDLKDALDKICEDSEAQKHLSEMTESFNGFHFCTHKEVETVYNTETCLAYLQSIVDGDKVEAEDPPNSEISQQFLEKFTTSAPLIIDFEKALQRDENENFARLKYDRFKQEFTLKDLVC
jgi:hypothetical protein